MSLPESATASYRIRLAATIAIIFVAAGAHSAWAWTGKVTHVTDGDTLWVQAATGGAPVKLRIDGIDAPEICQAGGRAARAALAARVAGQAVGVQIRRQDDYGRGVARLTLGGDDLGAWMLRQGHAWAYRQRSSDAASAHARLQRQARADRRGLFADPAAQHPRLFRQQHGPCRV